MDIKIVHFFQVTKCFHYNKNTNTPHRFKNEVYGFPAWWGFPTTNPGQGKETLLQETPGLPEPSFLTIGMLVPLLEPQFSACRSLRFFSTLFLESMPASQQQNLAQLRNLKACPSCSLYLISSWNLTLRLNSCSSISNYPRNPINYSITESKKECYEISLRY